MKGADYRSDIDGLRAVAVLAVVLFHVRGLWVPGGYGGVDVFFVISGYLITGILAREMTAGDFSLAAFYERRIRRLAPALFAVLLATTVLALVLFLPAQVKELGKSLQGVASLTANFHFMRKTGYFAPTSEEVPLLHTWSLAVEEQFYLIFPLVLWFIMRQARQLLWPVLVTAFLASLFYSIQQIETAPAVAFFSTTGRVWELMLGAMAALIRLPPLPRVVCEAIAAAGLAAIFAGYALFDSTTPFPGLNAMVFCAGAAAVIVAGEHTRTFTSRLLSLPPLRGIGLVSYSVYLWHWPLIVFWRYRYGTPDVPQAALVQSIGLLTGSLVLGYLSWRYIEQPFRRVRGPQSHPRLFGRFAIGTVGAVLVGFVLIRSAGFPGRWPGSDELLAERAVAESEICTPFSGTQQWQRETCVIGDEAKAQIFLWGDSHARMFIEPLAQLVSAGNQGFLLAGMGGCPPLLDVQLHGRSKNAACNAFTKFVMERIETLRPRRVVIAARWAHYFSGQAELEGGTPIALSPEGRHLNAAVASELLEETVRRIRAVGSDVVIIGPVPEQRFLVAPRVVRNSQWGLPLPPELSRAAYAERQKDTLATLMRLAKLPGVRVLYPDKYLCGKSVCVYARDGKPLYFDSNHLNPRGLRELLPLLQETIG